MTINFADGCIIQRVSDDAIKYAFNNKNIFEHLAKFDTPELKEYIKLIDRLHNNEPKISVNSLKLSYKIYQDTGKLFIPIYYRTYYGHWQKSSGACSGLIYWYNEKQPNKINEYMTFERLTDMVNTNQHILIQEPDIYNQFSAEVWTEDRE